MILSYEAKQDDSLLSHTPVPNQREVAFSHNHPLWLPSVTNNHLGAPGGFPAWPFYPLMHTVTISHVACSDLCVPALILDQYSICCLQLHHKWRDQVSGYAWLCSQVRSSRGWGWVLTCLWCSSDFELVLQAELQECSWDMGRYPRWDWWGPWGLLGVLRALYPILTIGMKLVPDKFVMWLYGPRAIMGHGKSHLSTSLCHPSN